MTVSYYTESRTANSAGNRHSQVVFLNVSWHFQVNQKLILKMFTIITFYIGKFYIGKSATCVGTGDRAVFQNIKLKDAIQWEMSHELWFGSWRDANYLHWTCSTTVVIDKEDMWYMKKSEKKRKKKKVKKNSESYLFMLKYAAISVTCSLLTLPSICWFLLHALPSHI